MSSTISAVIENSGYDPGTDVFVFDVSVTAALGTSPGTYTLTCSNSSTSVPFGKLIVYSPTPVITSIQITPPLYAGGQAYAIIYGSNFGAPGSVSVCSSTDSSCSSTPDISVQPNPYWYCQIPTFCQVNVQLTAGMNAAGPYDVQINSAGTGSGFIPAPQGPTPATSNRAGFQVGAISLSLQRQSYRQFFAVGSPDNGQFTETMMSQQGQNFASITGTSTTSNSATVVLTAPVNPAGNGSPSPGGLSTLQITYGGGGAIANKTAPIAAWGLSCYRLSLESDFFNPATGCSNYTIAGVTYSGQTFNPPGLTGLYCNSFLGDTKLQGSGMDYSGNLVHYNGSGNYKYIDSVVGTDGTQVVRGATAARDRNIVPDRNVTLGLDGMGTFYLNDTGGAIVGYRIDLFGGPGMAACRNFTNPITIGACNPASGGCPSYNTK